MITEKQAGLTPEQVDDLVTGAQKFLAPAADPRDDERLTPTKEQSNIKNANHD